MRIRVAFSESGTDSQGRHRTAPVHVADLPSGARAPQVPPIVFLKCATEKPGPKGPSEALIRAIVELESRNPRFGCPRIARIISQTFGVDIDKNVVHRVLANLAGAGHNNYKIE